MDKILEYSPVICEYINANIVIYGEKILVKSVSIVDLKGSVSLEGLFNSLKDGFFKRRCVCVCRINDRNF